MKVVLLFSGGLDSTVLLYQLRAEGDEVLPITINYGQRHIKEIAAARLIAQRKEVVISGLELTSSLTDMSQEVPDGHYTDTIMKQTVVPNRNMMMLSIAAAYAISNDAAAIAFAAHAGDHAVYPDCRTEFVDGLQGALTAGNYRAPRVIAPFINQTKANIVAAGWDYDVPFGLTWSCYKGGEIHCGTCGTCVERKEAFQLARVDDPTEYLV